MKKAQLEIMESAFVLIIIFAILSIAIIFVIAQQRGASKDQLEQYLILSHMKKSSAISLLPEVQYSTGTVSSSDHYDRIALLSFKDTVESNRLYYTQLFQNVRLRVDEFDYLSGWTEYELFDFSPSEYESMMEFIIPVVLVDPETYDKTLGVIYLEMYK
jgi:hypothetical protein